MATPVELSRIINSAIDQDMKTRYETARELHNHDTQKSPPSERMAKALLLTQQLVAAFSNTEIPASRYTGQIIAEELQKRNPYLEVRRNYFLNQFPDHESLLSVLLLTGTLLFREEPTANHAHSASLIYRIFDTFSKQQKNYRFRLNDKMLLLGSRSEDNSYNLSLRVNGDQRGKLREKFIEFIAHADERDSHKYLPEGYESSSYIECINKRSHILLLPKEIPIGVVVPMGIYTINPPFDMTVSARRTKMEIRMDHPSLHWSVDNDNICMRPLFFQNEDHNNPMSQFIALYAQPKPGQVAKPVLEARYLLGKGGVYELSPTVTDIKIDKAFAFSSNGHGQQ